jgi:MHS family proline/betaine transporter-like MFS transporter
MKKLNWALVGGHVLGSFDNTLYGFFAVMLAPLFFPSSSESANILASYGAFAAGFFARPLGAIVFGSIGDKKGRKSPLMWSMCLIGIPTLMIGFIPSYDSIGITAPIILVTCRLIQGFFSGAEFSGVSLYISENFSQDVVGSNTGLLISWGVFGAIVATACGAVVTSEVFPEWAWRIPFILGGLGLLSVFKSRQSLKESVDFEEYKKKGDILVYIWKELLKNHKTSLLTGFLLGGITIAPLYSATILGNAIFKELGYSTSESMLFNLMAMIVDGIFIAIFGKIADKIGFQRQTLFGLLIIALLSIPAFWLISGRETNIWDIIIFINLLVISGSVINGCAMPYLVKLFPTNCRYSGVAASVTFGHALLGGTTPLVGAYFYQVFNTRVAPAGWVFLMSILSFLVILFQTRVKKAQGISVRK